MNDINNKSEEEELFEIMEIKGWLKMKDSKNQLWHRRFCLLRENKFIIYKDENFNDFDFSLYLYPETTVEQIIGAQTPRFMIAPPSSNPYLFSSDSNEDIQRWIQGIRNSLEVTPLLTMASFQILSVLGRGFFGKVMLVQHCQTGQQYAIKSIQKSRLIQTKKSHTVIAERNVLMKTKHPFIVQLHFAFQTPSKFYLGLEYVSGGELFYHLEKRKSFPINEVRLYVAEIGLALNYLHSIGIIYRDLKPENVMLDAEGHIKLTDFGLAKELIQSDSTSTLCGTSDYLAPEMVMKIQYGYEVDWWSLGILMFEMLTNTTPFHDENKSIMFNEIINSNPDFPPNIPDDAIELMSALLTKNPIQRPSFEIIKKFRFFENLNWDKVYKREYQPEFIPPFDNDSKTSNFDPTFTKQTPADSLGSAIDHNFPGFSYAGSSFENNNSLISASPLSVEKFNW